MTKKKDKRKQEKDDSSNEVSESSLIEIMEVDPEVFRPIANPEQLAAYFDQDGLFKVPEGTAADRWEDAQRFVAEALDARDEMVRLFHERIGPPFFWGATAIQTAQEVHELAECAISAGVLGITPSSSEWENTDRLGGFPFNFSDCVKSAVFRAANATVPGEPYPENFRARLAFLMASGCNVVLNQSKTAKYSNKIKEDFNGDLSHFRLMPPHYLVNKIDKLHDTARFLALASQEKRRGQKDPRDNLMFRIAAVAQFLFHEVHHTKGLIGDRLPGTMRPGVQGEGKAEYETLVTAINCLGKVSPAERCGAALLFGSTIYGWGEKASGETFRTALARVQAVASPGDEDTSPMSAAYPVLRLKKALNKALTVLGHNADNLSDGAYRAAKTIAGIAARSRRSKMVDCTTGKVRPPNKVDAAKKVHPPKKK